MVVGKFLAEGVEDGRIGGGEVPGFVVTAMGIGEDETGFVIGIGVTVDGQQHMDGDAREQAQGKGDGQQADEVFAPVCRAQGQGEEAEGQQEEESGRGERRQPGARLQGGKGSPKGERGGHHPEEILCGEFHAKAILHYLRRDIIQVDGFFERFVLTEVTCPR